ncbi:TetR/AcrR family transcriptional regulator [Prauserella oleivorans]|uniref:TetR/AcrR family transcriptional regulator n=1 Tax=Prauserella oleivorans TaxID=1478153 RepID=A0ABW5WA29_9PSEU
MAADADSSSPTRRPWRGVEADERQARRRRQLLDAAFAIMGTEGAAAVTMRGVCRRARLTERYFYESFSGREELLVEVLAATANRAREVLLTALADAPGEPLEFIRHVVRAFTEFVTADPRRGRVLFVESLAAPELTSSGASMVGDFTATIADGLGRTDVTAAHADEHDLRLNAQAVFGALAYLYQAWLTGAIDVDRDRFVEHVAQVIGNLARSTSVR